MKILNCSCFIGIYERNTQVCVCAPQNDISLLVVVVRVSRVKHTPRFTEVCEEYTYSQQHVRGNGYYFIAKEDGWI